jgi:ATP-dependent DNA helicase RecG
VTAPARGTNGAAAGDGGGRTLRYLDGLPVTVLESLPPKKADALGTLEVATVLDLLTLYPRRHIDRTRQSDVADLAVGDEAVVLAQVQSSRLIPGRGRAARVEVVVADDTGRLKIVFFNQRWRAKQLTAGMQALFSGKLTDFRGTRQMVNPLVDVLVGTEDDSLPASRRTLRVVPVYPASAKAGLTSWEIGNWVAEALKRAGTFADPLPAGWREQLGLEGRTEALHGIHEPETTDDIAPARKRLIFDEFFRLQLALVLRRRSLERDARGIRHAVVASDANEGAATPQLDAEGPPVVAPGLVRAFLAALPFTLTAAQRAAIRRILGDMAAPLPMHRLLQGDVGSGKTVVALAALLAAVQGGHQGALMVPTEVLAEQHFANVSQLIGDLSVPDPERLGGRRPVRVALLTNRTTASERTELHEGLRSGQVDVLVGTHALLTDEVQFHSLGAVVIDEQHRFGVEQRAALREKGGADPDVLVMTATPIPRTAAMIVFGDLDMTVLDELPPGRIPVTTRWTQNLHDEEAWGRVRSEVAAGHRAFVVCPLVEGSERVEARAATEEFERLSVEDLAGLRLGLLHGQLPSRAKEQAIESLRSGEIDVLVATTVVEVGVDVVDATVMVVLDADRFGIAQLHQLRGRVGRGSLQSWCYLLGSGASAESAARLAALERTNDGFALAEEDLLLRGEGTLLGARQKGRSDLRLASLQRDRALLLSAREVAEAIVAADPLLEGHPLLEDETRLFLSEEEAEFLFKS